MAFTKAQAFDLLVSLKVKKVEIKYQGGNDEGYVGGIAFHTNDGNTEKVEEDSCDEFHKALCSPLYEAYGNFDGDFQVDGTLTWVVGEDITNRTITNTGEETRPQTDGFSREIEWDNEDNNN
jgi:hypothetical protein